MGKVRTKKPVAPPPFMLDTINSIVQCTDDEQLLSILKRFEAPFRFERAGERSLYNWIDVLNRIDEALEKCIGNEPMVLLLSSSEVVPDDEIDDITPRKENSELIYHCLRVTLLLVSNASDDTKNVYNSVEYLGDLLAMEDEKIILLALEIIRSLLHGNSRLRPTRAHESPKLGNMLLTLSRGCWEREGGPGLVECLSSPTVALPSEGGSIRLYFMKKEGSGAQAEVNDASVEYETMNPNGKKSVVSVDDVRTLAGDEKWFIKTYSKEFDLPRRLRFTMSTRYRRARAFVGGLEARTRHTNVRLLALATLAQMQLSPEPLTFVFYSEPELVSELVALSRADAADGLADLPLFIRISALKCLTSISNHGQRLKQVISITDVSSHNGILPSMLRSEIALLFNRNASQQPSKAEFPMDWVALRGIEGEFAQADIVEALLGLVFAIATAFPMSQGPTFLVASGAVGTMVPLLNDRTPTNSRVVLHAIWALKCIIENTQISTGAAAFRDHSGLTLIARRIVTEVCEFGPKDLEDADEGVEVGVLEMRGESRELYDSLAQKVQPPPSHALKTMAPSSSAASRGALPHFKWALLRALLRLLSLAHRNSGGSIRELTGENFLKALRIILARPFYFGGSLFAASATATADMAHAEPTAASTIAESGLPQAILKSIAKGLPPSGEAIRCIPGVLAAICLSPAALKDVEAAAVIMPYMMRLFTPFYGRAMHGETPLGIGTALEELKRHVPSLQIEITNAFLMFLQSVAKFIRTEEPDSESTDADVCDVENPPATDSKAMIDKMKLTVAYNASRLGGFVSDISDKDYAATRSTLISLLDICYAPAFAGIDSGVVSVSSSSPSAPTASNTLNSIINAIRRLDINFSGHLCSLLSEHFVRDTEAFLYVGTRLGENWLDEETGRGFPLREHSNVANEESREDPDSGTEPVEIDSLPKEAEPCEGSSHSLDQAPADSSSRSNVAANVVDWARLTGPNRSRRYHQRRLNELARKLRVNIVILSGLPRMHDFAIGYWGITVAQQLGAIIATMERACRWHLARAFTGVTVEMTKEPDYFFSAKVTAMSRSPPEAPEDGTKHAKDAVASGAETSSGMHGKSNAEKPELASNREELNGLAWSLATLIASTERLYRTLSRDLTAKTKKTSSRETVSDKDVDSIKNLASMLGRILTTNLVSSVTMWTNDDEKEVQNCLEAPEAWNYLRGVLREIRTVLFANPWGDAPSQTQPLVLEAFLMWGGGCFLQKILSPQALLAATKPIRPLAENGFTSAAWSSNEVGDLKQRSDTDASTRVQEQGGVSKSSLIEEHQNALMVTTVIDVLESFGQLIYRLCDCDGLSNSNADLSRICKWKAQELHRTSQVVAIQALGSILQDNNAILCSDKLRDQVISFLIVLIHKIVDTREALEKEDRGAANDIDHGADGMRRPSGDWGLDTALPENSMLTRLVGMGFRRERATSALLRAGQNGIVGATEWLLSQEDAANEDADDAEDSDAHNLPGEPLNGGSDMEIQTDQSVLSSTIVKACCLYEIQQLEKAVMIHENQHTTPADVKAIKEMVRSFLPADYVDDKKGSFVDKRKSLEQRKTSPITRHTYQETVQSFFISLRALAISAVRLLCSKGASKDSAYLVVDLSTALEKGSELDEDSQEVFASIIMSSFSGVLQDVSAMKPSGVIGKEQSTKIFNMAQIATVWTHLGGANARERIRKKDGLVLIVDFLEKSFTRFWEANGAHLGVSLTDEEAAEPIEGLTLTEEGGSMKQRESNESVTVKEATAKVCAMALLILDGFIRYSRTDTLSEFSSSIAESLRPDSTSRPGESKAASEADEKMADSSASRPESDKTLEDIDAEAKANLELRISQLILKLEPVTVGKGVKGIDSAEIMDMLLKMLASPLAENPDCFIALIQMACGLTEDFETGRMFLQRGGVELIWSVRNVKSLSWKNVNGLFRTLLRHLVEDDDTLLEAMEQEIRSLLSANRFSSRLNLLGLVRLALPVLHRDPELFVKAVAKTCRLNPSLEAITVPEALPKVHGDIGWNVHEVVRILVDGMVLERYSPNLSEQDYMAALKITSIALLRVTELVEWSSTCASAFLMAKVRADSETDAFDYVLNNLLPLPPRHPPPKERATFGMLEDISEASRQLFTALCGVGSHVRARAVEAMARACAREAESENPRAGMLKSIAMCFALLKEEAVALLFKLGIVASMARCLDKLDLSGVEAGDTGNAVLKSFVLLGQVATNMPPSQNNSDGTSEPEAM
ncbi:hypothetical protein NDN08_004304 [Rhodosorus marinus]|uniref:UBA domain-containing protein n=1 Tax=Rhodosorus marinus TaxID=101924 RepID=A0AAV8ULB2_9RHOD|nr:hypothetical protein NDN08_004304 [Rhodosorus marinus]